MAALIGALRVSLSAETAKFEAGMKRAQRQTQVSASAMQKSLGWVKSGVAGLVAGLSVGMFTTAIRNALEYAGSLQEVADQLGVTTKDLQVFRYAAAQNGIAQAELDSAAAQYSQAMADVAGIQAAIDKKVDGESKQAAFVVAGDHLQVPEAEEEDREEDHGDAAEDGDPQ